MIIILVKYIKIVLFFNCYFRNLFYVSNSPQRDFLLLTDTEINYYKVTKLLYVLFQKEIEIFFENVCIFKHLYYNSTIIIKYINYINFGSIV